ncbi:MAG: radical SAM protein [Actinomycetaceae bacterium]|nr:radical SAM protein [Actinomycetaceae bacterium]
MISTSFVELEANLEAAVMHLSKYCNLSEAVYRVGNSLYRLAFVATTCKVVALLVNDRKEVVLEAYSKGSLGLLRDLGVITNTSPQNEERIQIKRLSEANLSEETRVFIPMMTAACNLACLYCGQRTRPQFMNEEITERLLGRVLEASENPRVRTIEFRWYGGEPLMAFHSLKRVSAKVKHITENRNLTFRSMISTNGTLATLERVRELYEIANLRLIVITLDGAKSSHDVMRLRKSGRGSFDDILSNLTLILSALEDLPRLQLIIRINLSKTSSGSLEVLFLQLMEIGAAHPRVRISIVPVYDWGNDNSRYKIESDTQLCDPYIKAVRDLAKTNLSQNIFPLNEKGRICSAVSRQEEVISPDGALYSCTEYPIVPKYEREEVLGNIGEIPLRHLRPSGKFDNWLETKQAQQCRSCTFLPACGGTCPKRWFDGESACPQFRIHFQALLDVWAEKHGLEKDE